MVGKPAVICKALYGLKSSGAAWQAHLAMTLHDLQYRSSLADPDVWLRPNVKTNGELFYEYAIVYVDDILVIAEHPKKTMDCLAKLYRLKEGSQLVTRERKFWNIDFQMKHNFYLGPCHPQNIYKRGNSPG